MSSIITGAMDHGSGACALRPFPVSCIIQINGINVCPSESRDADFALHRKRQSLAADLNAARQSVSLFVSRTLTESLHHSIVVETLALLIALTCLDVCMAMWTVFSLSKFRGMNMFPSLFCSEFCRRVWSSRHVHVKEFLWGVKPRGLQYSKVEVMIPSASHIATAECHHFC
jgi:hypothetical protein